MDDLKDRYGLTSRDLNIDLGPLGHAAEQLAQRRKASDRLTANAFQPGMPRNM